MKKFLLSFFTLLLITSVLGACSDNESNKGSAIGQTDHAKNEQTNKQTDKRGSINITLSKDKGKTILSEKKLTIQSGDILMDVLKENFKIEEDDGFIKRIDGIAPKKGEKKAWMYSVNGKMSTVGAKDYKLKPGDEIVFDLQPWE